MTVGQKVDQILEDYLTIESHKKTIKRTKSEFNLTKNFR